MTGHDLDLEACKRIPHPVAKMLVAEVESLCAKLAATEQERDVARAEAEILAGVGAEFYRQLTDYLRRLDPGLRELARTALAPAEQDENVLSELVGRVQWACSQITDALADSRVIANPATAAWLRTIRDTLANASGDIPVATAEQDEPTPEQS